MRRGPRRASFLLAGVVVGISVVAGSCGVPGQKNPTELANDDVRAPTPTTRPGTPVHRRIQLCFVDGDRLAAVLVPLPTPLSVPRTLAALVKASQGALPVGSETEVADPTLLTAGPTTRGIAHLGLSDAFAHLPRTKQVLTAAQVVCTLTSMPGIGQVLFTHNGQRMDIPRGDGSLTRHLVSRVDYAALLPAP